MKQTMQSKIAAGFFELGAFELPMTRSQKRCFVFEGGKFYVSAQAIRRGATVQTSRPVSEAFKMRVLDACACADDADALMAAMGGLTL